MRICYVLLSPTFGMHQYTADLANRMAADGHAVTLVTTTLLPRDRYAPSVNLQTPITLNNTGFSRQGLNYRQQERIVNTIVSASPQVLHFTGPHLWNINLLRRFRRLGIRVIHTIHDLDPHLGMRLGPLLRVWNRLIIREADHILVHGRIYQQRLIRQGLQPQKVTYTPLLHLFVGHAKHKELIELDTAVSYPKDQRFALFFGRLEKYKGVDHLVAAFARLHSQQSSTCRLVIAGPGKIAPFWPVNLPPNVELHNHLIGDEEAVDLFTHCSLVILPYTDATQSALVAAAYFFRKPVIVSNSGALSEYVLDGKTGFIVEAGNPNSLARTISEACHSPHLLQEMGEAGRAWYEKYRLEEFETLSALYTAYSDPQ